jgi:transmembrane sensor
MTHTPEHIALLFFKQLNGEISPEEAQVLEAWVSASENHQALANDIADEFTLRRLVLQEETDARLKTGERLFARVKDQLDFPALLAAPGVHRIHFLKTAWFRYAASMLLLVGLGVMAYFLSIHKAPVDMASNAPVPMNNIAPGSNRATLILGDESVLDLDSIHDGMKLLQGGMQVIKSADGEIMYVPVSDQGENGPVLINTMKTPRGGQYQLTLPDRTKVWLNAESSITYPTAFKDKTRQVSVTGEVYFEVAENKNQPFVIESQKQEITVLGTSFNVSGYAGENQKISLVTGAIKINGQVLKPNQAWINNTILSTNTAQDIAWKDGLFNFNEQSLQQVMRQISRWYDVEVVYEKGVPKIDFTGEMSRNLSLAEVVDFLRGSQVNIDWNGHQLIIKK